MIVQELFAKLGLDIDERSFTLGNVMLEATKKSLIAIGTFALAGGTAIAGMLRSTANYGDQIYKTSQKIGISTGALQELRHAAELSDVSFESLANGLGLLARKADDAAQRGGVSAESFKRLGIQVKASDGSMRPAEELLGDVADRFAAMPDGIAKTALAMELFGRAGKDMIPLLNGGRAGIGALRQEARDFGLVLDDKTLKASEEFNDSLTRVKSALNGVKFEIGGALLEDARALADRFTAWVRANRELIRQRVEQVIGLITGALSLAFRVLRLVSAAVEWVTRNWKYLATVLGGVVLAAIVANAAALGTLLTVYRLLAIQALITGAKIAAGWALALAPLLPLIAGMVALVAVGWDIYNWITGSESVLRDLWYTWVAFVDEFTANEDDDWWLTTLIKSAWLTIHNLAGAWRDAWDDMKRYAAQFFDWYERKLADMNPFHKVGQAIGDLAAGDTSGGVGFTSRRGDVGPTVFGGGASPEATASSRLRDMSRANPAFAPQVNVHVNGAADPKAVAAEVQTQVETHWDRMVRQFAATEGG